MSFHNNAFVKQLQKKDPSAADLSVSAGRFFRQLILGWLIAATVEYILLPVQLRTMDSLSGLAEMSLPRLAAVTLSVTLALHYIPEKFHPPVLERWMIAFVSCFYAYQINISGVPEDFTFTTIGILCLLIFYAICGSRQDDLPSEKQDPLYLPGFLIVLLAALGFIAYVGGWGLCRALSFGASTYDLGIFAQMFHSMKTSGLPMTTLERGYLLSHFAVHVSPIYYLLLPFYCLAPGAHTLNLLQAVLLGSSVLPLWRLCRSYGLRSAESVLVCLALLLAPALSGGTSYDFHENAFLTPLILWLFYAVRKQSTALIVLFSLLTLFVKEDSAVYVAVMGLWLFIDSLLHSSQHRLWGILTGAGMVLFSVGYFLGVVNYLAAYGDGVMTYRYRNLMFDGTGSLLTVVKAALLSPMKVLYECVDAEKTEFILQTLGIFLCIPLLTRRYQRFILLIPYLLINLVSDYSYQHSIFFQYSFGSLAFLIYLILVNLADLKGSRKRIIALTVIILLSVNCVKTEILPKVRMYINRYSENQSSYQERFQVLSEIPQEATVAATTYLTVPLSQRDVIYDITYAEPYNVLTADYVVIQCNDEFSLRKYATENSIGYQELIDLLTEHGYTLKTQCENVFVIYAK